MSPRKAAYCHRPRTPAELAQLAAIGRAVYADPVIAAKRFSRQQDRVRIQWSADMDAVWIGNFRQRPRRPWCKVAASIGVHLETLRTRMVSQGATRSPGTNKWMWPQ